MQRLPPLNALRAFEAAGRLGSVSRAACELSVTPAAVSHQIRALEEHLQLQLFVRTHRAITLTLAGEQYLADVSKHLTGLRRSTQKVISMRDSQSLRIQSHATFAMRWLIPRLSSFHASEPSIEVKLTTCLATSDVDAAEFDAAIRLGDGAWKGFRACGLVPNRLAPVCKPAFLASRPYLADPSGLSGETLLHSLARPDDWARWLAAKHVSTVNAYSGLKYESSVLSYQAAIEGQGIALAQQALVEDDIRAGRLVYLYDDYLDLGGYTYYLLWPIDVAASPALELFRKWLVTSNVQSGGGAG